MRKTLAAALLGMTMAACGGGSDATTTTRSPTPDPVQLAGTRWVATALFLGGAPVDIVPGADPTVDFDDTGRGVSGTTGCNSYFGEYQQGAGTISFSGLGMTEMACEPPRMQQESDVITILQQATEFTLGEDKLTIGRLGGSAMELIPRDTAFPDAALAGTQWIADSLIMGDSVSSMPAANPVTLLIDAVQSRASGSMGCNMYQASVEFDSTQITFGAFTEMTEMDCPDPGVMDQEAFVRAIFQGELSVEIEGSRLTLLDRHGDGLSFQAED